MNYVKPKVFDITKKRPAVLLVGNGLNRCMGDTNTWLNAILKLTKDDGILDSDKDMNYSIRATVTTDENEKDRWAKYAELFGKEFKYIDNPLLKNLLKIPFDAVLTTNYTYEMEKAMDPSYVTSIDKEIYACTTAENLTPEEKQPDSVRLLNTFNRMNNGSHDMDIWHIHGEVREPASMILTHEEYGRLVYELISHEQNKRNSETISFDSWVDYFIYGDLYVLGQGIDFAEFDLWWLLSRRNREKNRSTKSFFYSPQEKGKVFTKIEDALDQIGLRIEHCGIELPDKKEASPAEMNKNFITFYEKATERISNRVLSPLPPDTEKLIDCKAFYLRASSRINHLRLLSQLYKTDVFVPVYYSPLFIQGYRHLRKIHPYEYKLNDGSNGIFIYSTEKEFKGELEDENDVLMKMSGKEAFQLIMKSRNVSAFCLDIYSNEIWTDKSQLEYVLNNIDKIDQFLINAEKRDRQKRRKNALIASESTHHVQSFIANCSFANTLEELQQDLNTWGYFNYECIFFEEEFMWTSPKWAKVGDVVFFYHTKKALINISSLQRNLKTMQGKMPTDKYLTYEEKLKKARDNYEKYGAKIFAIGQVCAEPEMTSDEDPFGITDNDLYHWGSKNYACMSNICVLKNPVPMEDFTDFITLSPGGSYTMVLGEQFERLRDLIIERNKDQEDIPYYFRKSMAATEMLSSYNDDNWTQISNEVRRQFTSRTQFQSFYTDFLLKAIGDTKKNWLKCRFIKDGVEHDAYMDQVISFNKKFLPVRVLFPGIAKKVSPDKFEKYCYPVEVFLDDKKTVDANHVYTENVLVIDVEYISLYDSKLKEIRSLMQLDNLKSNESVFALKEKLAAVLAGVEIEENLPEDTSNETSADSENLPDPTDTTSFAEKCEPENNAANDDTDSGDDKNHDVQSGDLYRGALYTPVDFPVTPIGWAEYCLPSQKAEIARRASMIVENEGVILRDKLMEKLRTSFGVKASDKVTDATEKALKAAKIKTTKVKGVLHCWASAVDPKTYTSFRYHEDVKRRDDELPLPELRNAVVRTLMDSPSPLDENDLLVQTARTFGYQRLGPNLKARLQEGIAYAVSDKLIRLNKQKKYELREA